MSLVYFSSADHLMVTGGGGHLTLKSGEGWCVVYYAKVLGWMYQALWKHLGS